MYNYKFIGWSTDGGSDKVWGVIFLETPKKNFTNGPWWAPARHTGAKCVTFWGRRGKKFQSKLSYDDYDLQKVIQSKIDKGYKSVNTEHLNDVYPEFEKDLNKLAIWSTLKF
jgi:hypothetical protein